MPAPICTQAKANFSEAAAASRTDAYRKRRRRPFESDTNRPPPPAGPAPGTWAAAIYPWEQTETLYQGDDALSTKPVMHYQAQLISATRRHASQPKVLAMATDGSATCQEG